MAWTGKVPGKVEFQPCAGPVRLQDQDSTTTSAAAEHAGRADDELGAEIPASPGVVAAAPSVVLGVGAALNGVMVVVARSAYPAMVGEQRAVLVVVDNRAFPVGLPFPE